jgi:hypothetical protein|tara:strand:- start:43 stop:669 length:627 start_codon:yes stop_codon:yes gene_type:complete
MKAPFDFVIEPKGNRYNNTKKVGDKDLILNTEVYNHQFVNRQAIVKSVPTAFETDIKPGDEVIVHHNVFRRWHDVRGKERNSKSFFNENTYLVKEDQIFLVKYCKSFSDNNWYAPRDYCFVQPIKDTNYLTEDVEKPCVGKVVYSSGKYKKGDLVGFTPFSTYEFVIDGKRLYRVMTQFITIKYEYQGNEKEYNPSWAESSGGIDQSS